MSYPLCYTNRIIKMNKELTVETGKPQNVVYTDRIQNIAAAVESDSLRDAGRLFRALQHANNMGTTEADFAELERKYYEKHGYPYEG